MDKNTRFSLKEFINFTYLKLVVPRDIRIVIMKLRSHNFKVKALTSHSRPTNQTETSGSGTAPKTSSSHLEASEIQSQRLGSRSHSEEFRNEMQALNLLSSEMMLHSSNHQAFDNMQ